MYINMEEKQHKMMKESRRSNRSPKIGIEASSKDRNILLEKISALFDKNMQRALTGRIRSEKGYTLRLKELRALSYAAGIIGNIQKESEMEEVLKLLDKLDAEEKAEHETRDSG